MSVNQHNKASGQQTDRLASGALIRSPHHDAGEFDADSSPSGNRGSTGYYFAASESNHHGIFRHGHNPDSNSRLSIRSGRAQKSDHPEPHIWPEREAPYAAGRLDLSSHAYGIILAGRVLQGIGAAGAMPIVLPLVGDLFRSEEQVSAGLGLIETSNTFGKVLSPILGSALALLAWQAPFWSVPVLCALSIALVLSAGQGSSQKRRCSRPAARQRHS